MNQQNQLLTIDEARKILGSVPSSGVKSISTA